MTGVTTEAALDAERAILGAMLVSSPAMWAGLDAVDCGDFYDPKHAEVFTVMGALARRREPVDTISVGDELLRTGATGRVPVDFVHALTSAVTTATAGAVEYYADIVHRHAVLRRVRAAAEKLVQGSSSGGDVFMTVDDARKILDGVAPARRKVETIGAGMDDLVGKLDKPPSYRPTPWPRLNAIIDGLMPGAVYVVAARPGSGKTIVGLQIAREMCRYGLVSFHSLEMPREQLLRRLIAAESGLSLTTLSRHTLTPDDWRDRFAPARSRIIDLPLHVDDEGTTLEQIESYAREVSRRGSMSCVVVDYLQLIPTTDSHKSRWEHVGDVTRAFKLLAKHLDVPVVLLCQLNRESERMKRLPTLADLRESGSIEQDADVVLMLHRQTDDQGDLTDLVDMLIAKNRHGRQGRIELGWEGKYARLQSIRWGTPAVDVAAMQAGFD